MTLGPGPRRRVWPALLPAAVLAATIPLFPRYAFAQRPVAGEGALDLVLPTGARAVALGQAAMALDGTTESVWWNPSALAGMRGTTAAVHHSQSIGGKS